jgi:hypothetical protein
MTMVLACFLKQGKFLEKDLAMSSQMVVSMEAEVMYFNLEGKKG